MQEGSSFSAKQKRCPTHKEAACNLRKSAMGWVTAPQLLSLLPSMTREARDTDLCFSHPHWTDPMRCHQITPSSWHFFKTISRLAFLKVQTTFGPAKSELQISQHSALALNQASSFQSLHRACQPKPSEEYLHCPWRGFYSQTTVSTVQGRETKELTSC